jgi:drug/metabolite transporter (DMT)-like permease
MAAVLGGLGAAIIWSVGSVGASRAARGLGPMLTLAWVMLIGFVIVGVILPFSPSASPSVGALVWLVLGGAGNVGGLLLMYRALRIGQMGVVMPIVTTEGGIAAAIAIAAGQSVSTPRGAALTATVIGVAMTAISRRPATAAAGTAPAVSVSAVPVSGGPRAVGDPSGHDDRQAAAWASLGAVAFGIGLYATARAGAVLPASWAVMPPRVVGVVAVTLPLACSGRLRRPHGYVGWLLLSGVCEVGGFFAYTLAARHGIAVAAVLATLTGAFGTAFGRLLFGERLRATQLAGVAVTFAAVATLSSLSA